MNHSKEEFGCKELLIWNFSLDPNPAFKNKDPDPTFIKTRMHFRIRSQHPDPDLKLQAGDIPVLPGEGVVLVNHEDPVHRHTAQ